MPIDPEIANWTAETREAYGADRTILYALGIGAGHDARDVPLVFEQRLRPLQTIAVVLANEGFWLQDPRTGADWRKAVHGTQTLEIRRPLPATGELVGRMRVEALVDKGAGGHAIVRQVRELYDARTGEHMASCGSSVVLRDQGGFGGAAADAGARPRRRCPEGAPDFQVTYATRPEQAAIYRLSGDRNPLHVDFDFAREVGFERPILHGLCTYGFAGRAVIDAFCAGAPERLRRLDGRFTAPVYPGETLTVELWRIGQTEASYRVSVRDRGGVAIDDGYTAWA